MAKLPHFALDNSYARDLDGFSVPWRPEVVPAPQSLFFNAPLAEELGLDAAAFAGEEGAALFVGHASPEGLQPIAQVYAGHQFGRFLPQLGDGRAVLLGEVMDRAGRRRDIALKGSGRTPYSRGGDGKAAVGPMLREVLIGEAMHALGIPTTRALAVVATGQPVLREAGALPGAVLTRVAASHIRVGTFQFFAARGDVARVRQLAEYAIARHDAELVGTPRRFLGLLERVAERQAMLIAQWMNVGFIHGVMNTDNMTISGETIDYGPCAFVEAYDPKAVFSSIDSQGRYAFGNQPAIARWNLARLAESLLPLLDDDEDKAMTEAMRVIDDFPARYRHHLLGRPARQARAASASKRSMTTPTRHWPTTGWPCCRRVADRSTSRSPGVAWPMRRPATRRHCVRSSPTPHVASSALTIAAAGASAARAKTKALRQRGDASRRGARRAHAPRQPVGDSSQPSGRGGAGRRLRRRRPRPLRATARSAARALRRARRQRPLRRAGAGRSHGLLSHVLRHLIGRFRGAGRSARSCRGGLTPCFSAKEIRVRAGSWRAGFLP